ncbi:MAG: hypothetical protein EOP36_07675 [Rubrivivax sp.]|nr:MAG: hypothetical protein EOP36_07675 [Rubrivivax sp.]
MRFKPFVALAALAWAATVLPASAQSPFPTRYALGTEFPAPTTLPNAVAFRLNNQGQAAGTGVYTKGTTTRLVFINGWPRLVTLPVERATAVAWKAGQPALLKPLATNSATSVHDINDTGWVVGDSFKSSTAAKGYAVVWRDGNVTDLGAGLGSYAQYVNAQGWILGYRQTSSSNTTRQPFLWRNNRVDSLGTAPDSALYGNVDCVGLSDTGVVPCRRFISTIEGVVSQSFVWSNGVFEALSHPQATKIVVSAVSRNGIVAGLMALAGDVTTYGDPDRPFLWRNGQFTFLPRVPAGLLAHILTVTDQGTLLVDITSVNLSRQEVWTASGQVVSPLSSLSLDSGDTVVRVHDLNDQGQLLAAVKRGASGAERQVLLTPAAP